MNREAIPANGSYAEVWPLLRHVRIMERFFEEVAASEHAPPLDTRIALDIIYRAILNEELAQHALDLALAIIEIENAAPELFSDEEA